MSELVYLSNDYEAHCSDVIGSPSFNKRPIIINVNGFDESGVCYFRDFIQEANESGQPRVQVYVDSFGGDVYALIGMLDAMKHSSIPVDTICTTKAMSAGACLFSMGDIRYISPEATLMLHDFQQSISENTPVTNIQEHAEEGTTMRKTILALIDKHRCYPEGTLDKKLTGHGNWFIDAEEAKKEQLCDVIGPAPTLVVTVGCTMSFREK